MPISPFVMKPCSGITELLPLDRIRASYADVILRTGVKLGVGVFRQVVEKALESDPEPETDSDDEVSVVRDGPEMFKWMSHAFIILNRKEDCFGFKPFSFL